jgi:hypothetical protein
MLVKLFCLRVRLCGATLTGLHNEPGVENDTYVCLVPLITKKYACSIPALPPNVFVNINIKPFSIVNKADVTYIFDRFAKFT